MKVLFLFGGLPHYLVALLNLLQKVEKLDIVVVLPKEKSKTLGKGVWEAKDNCLFKIIRTEEYLFLGQKPYLKNLYKIFQEEKPQVIVVGWPYILGYFFSIRLRFFLKKNKIKTIFRSIPYQVPVYQEANKFYREQGFFDENMNLIKADTFPKKIKYWLITQINKLYFAWVDAHLNYTTLAYDILGSYGVPRQKIFVTYNSGDTDHLFAIKAQIANDHFEKDEKIRIVHIGRLVKWKKVDLLIDAFCKLQKNWQEVELLVIGDGPEMQNLQEKARQLGIADKVFFLGAIHDYTTLGKYLLNARVYVLAGAGGLSINDAMAFGVPVICSVADGTEQDLVLPEYSGLFFKENDVEDLAEKIEYLIKNPSVAQEMGKNAETLIREKINIHTVAARFIDCFNYVTNHQYSLKYDQ